MNPLMKILGEIFVGSTEIKRLDIREARTACQAAFKGRLSFERGGLYQPGDRIADKYEVLGTLGKGGFGVVYLMFHLPTKGIAAVKTFRDEFFSSASAREAFKREATTWVNVGAHANIL